MKWFTSLVLSVAVAVAVTHMAHGLPAPGKADAAKIQKNMAKNKAKKTQEVLQFGNQQNRQADTRNYARAEKRQAPDDHHDPEPVPEVNNALEHYPQSARHEKITDLFYNPDSYGIQSLDADDRYKRNAYHFGSPVKRSGSRVYGSYLDSGRAKRDLPFDPEELLALMSILEANKARDKSRRPAQNYGQSYGQSYGHDTIPYEENEIPEEDDEDDVQEVWEERPVVLAPSPKDFYINNEFQRKQRAQHGSKNNYFQGLNHYQEEPQYYRLSDFYRYYNY
ncbi:uncharacterized protein LOC132943466 isoform X1 [Metopolophium dirhodum]|uniref:uncharacterized protein LOC132943466 isoform X1 n=1 Tax=Metopolophium dirhodum TaxID=44670 RepID=UPI00298FFA50|nr:uncharacterized protein LOC132943466 isoform X1 [Metopolophium dirhodum]